MDISTLKDKLDGETLTKLQAHVDDLTGQRDAARAESIEGRKKLKAEAETLRGIKDKLYQKLGLDDDADLDALPDGKGQAEAAKQFETKLKSMERKLQEALTAKGEMEGKHKTALQKAALAEALAGHEFVARDVVETFVSGRLNWEGDDLLFKTDDGKLVSVKDGVTGFAKSRPELLKAAGAGGAGAKGTGAGGNGQSKVMARADFEALRPADRAKAMSEGISLTD